jgi:hypothetical protein
VNGKEKKEPTLTQCGRRSGCHTGSDIFQSVHLTLMARRITAGGHSSHGHLFSGQFDDPVQHMVKIKPSFKGVLNPFEIPGDARLGHGPDLVCAIIKPELNPGHVNFFASYNFIAPDFHPVVFAHRSNVKYHAFILAGAGFLLA